MTKEERREYKRQWYLANKDKFAERNKEYRQSNKDKIAEYMKKYYQANKEKILEQQKEYYQSNKEKIAEYMKEYQKEYYQTNREKKLEQQKEYDKKYLNTPIGRASNLLSRYNQSDKKYNRGQGDLTARWIVENIFTKPCKHCGKEGWDIIGCNRLDNSKPHTMDNVEPCCEECNKKLPRKICL